MDDSASKIVILERQKAFRKYGSESPRYKLIRNAVNYERKASKVNFNSKVELLKGENAKAGKKLSGWVA